jgi:hypothetical protein
MTRDRRRGCRRLRADGGRGDVFAVERSLASLEEVFLEVTGGETV